MKNTVPLHRQQAQFKRLNIDIQRNTLARWMIRSAELLPPLYNLCEDRLLAGPYIHGDESPIQVLNEAGKTPQSASYMWVRVSGLPDQKVILFDYAPTRGGDIARDLYAGYQGYLHTDDYSGYNAVCAQNNITQLGCWAHARRKFVEAKKAANPKGKGKKAAAGKADRAIELIGKLYAIEKKIKDQAPDVRLRIRQRDSRPILNTLRTWLDDTLHSVLPKGPLGKALSYLDKNWDKLCVYTEQGYLNIDNNPAENAIRPFVIGRKNWLFSATPKGAKASAMLYSMIETAKANGLEPFAYLTHVFKELPAAQTLEEVEALLPWRLDPQTLKTLAFDG